MNRPLAFVDANPSVACSLTLRCSVFRCGEALPAQQGRAGFTLVEMLVVIAVIAVLATLAMFGAGRMSESAGIAKSSQQMLQIHRAVMLWSNDNNGRLPVARTWYRVTYPYLMNSQQPPPGFFVPSNTADNLKGTPFYCPLREKSGEGTPVRSYGWSSRLRDPGSSSEDPVPRALVSLREPSKALMLATSKTRSAVNEHRTQFSTRCGGKVLLVFVDGHLEQRSLEDIPKSHLDVFWSPQ
jgi:prepilin-type N-terminal cleavage/methylation domain-containing protein